MKKFTLLLISIMVVGITYAQRTAETAIPVAGITTEFTQSKSTDTIFAPSFLLPCAANYTYYIDNSGAGYVTGNNSYGDTEKAQKFLSIPPNTTVSSVLAYVVAVTATGNTSMKLYSVNPTTKGPQTELGQSASIALSAVPAQNLTVYNFATPVAVSSEFFASVVLPTGATDTLVIVSTQDGCFSNDSLSWERWDTGDWYSIESIWGGLEIDMVIFPVIQTLVGTTEMAEDNLISIYPNPSNDVITIAGMNTVEQINVYNALGQIVKSENVNNNIYKLNVSDLNKGFYYIQVQTNKGIVSKTVLVN